MEELENVVQNTQSTQDVENEKVYKPFREFKTQEDFDNFSAYLMKKGEEKALKNTKVTNGDTTLDYKDYEKKYRKDLEAQIRADIERQAKMTEAEKLAEKEKEMAKLYDDREIELNRREARILLSKAGFEDEEGHKRRNVVGRGKETDSPLETSQKEYRLDQLTLAR